MTTAIARAQLIPEDWALIQDIEQATARLNSAVRLAQERNLVVDIKLNSTPRRTINSFEFCDWQVAVNIYARLSPR